MTTTDARVTDEPRTYSRKSPYSFFRDLMRSASGDRDASFRLDRHFDEVKKEIDRGSPEGRAALRQYEELTRPQMPYASREEIQKEVRAATSSTIAGFVTPQYIISQYEIFRGGQRTFADQCTKLPMPEVGLTINIPRLTVQASAGVQSSEGSLVTELDPSGADSTANLQTIAGTITASQQLIDQTRNAPNGPTFDVVLYAQLRDQYNQAVDNYVLSQAITGGAQVPGSATFSMANLYGDVAKAREALTDTSGVHLIPTHVFTTPDLYSYTTDQLDSSNRPILIPQFAPGAPLWPDEDNDKWRQFSGIVLPGNLMWFLDANVQTVGGTETQIIVARPEEIILFESDPVLRAFPETAAGTLQVVTQIYGYVAAIPRIPTAAATVVGAAYVTTEK